MARINVEDSLYRDIRFHDLVQKMGGVDAALGSVVRAWSVAQDYWLANGVGIPLPVWKSQRLRPEVVEVGLAEHRGEFVYVRGSEEQFAWLKQRSDAGKNGGKASGTARREKIEKKPKRNEAGRSGARRNEASYSSSFSLSSSFSDSSSISKEKEGTPAAQNAGAFFATYCEAWKTRYGTNPIIRGKEAGIAKRLAGDLGTEKASELALTFLRMNDAWFIQRRHDLTTFEQSINAVKQFHDTGATVTRSQARNQEMNDSNTQAVKDYLAGKAKL